jgi:hypothetical protein
MTVKISGTDGIDTAQLRAPDGDPVAITIAADGKVAFPATPSNGWDGPAFLAKTNAVQTLGAAAWTVLNFQVEVFDTANCFASNKFTPNVAGYYLFSGSAALQVSALCGSRITKNGTESYQGSFDNANYIGTTTILLYMNGTTDYVEFMFYASVAATINGVASPAFFSGFLARGV